MLRTASTHPSTCANPQVLLLACRLWRGCQGGDTAPACRRCRSALPTLRPMWRLHTPGGSSRHVQQQSMQKSVQLLLAVASSC
jgi:hypothetical protein